jgi:hypothetical protein
MDYEWKIKQLEEELRHEHAMRELQGSRLDAHDRSFDAIREIQAKTEQMLQDLTAKQTKTEGMLQDLIRAITAERSNGGKAK